MYYYVKTKLLRLQVKRFKVTCESLFLPPCVYDSPIRQHAIVSAQVKFAAGQN